MPIDRTSYTPPCLVARAHGIHPTHSDSTGIAWEFPHLLFSDRKESQCRLQQAWYCVHAAVPSATDRTSVAAYPALLIAIESARTPRIVSAQDRGARAAPRRAVALCRCRGVVVAGVTISPPATGSSTGLWTKRSVMNEASRSTIPAGTSRTMPTLRVQLTIYRRGLASRTGTRGPSGSTRYRSVSGR